MYFIKLFCFIWILLLYVLLSSFDSNHKALCCCPGNRFQETGHDLFWLSVGDAHSNLPMFFSLEKKNWGLLVPKIWIVGVQAWPLRQPHPLYDVRGIFFGHIYDSPVLRDHCRAWMPKCMPMKKRILEPTVKCISLWLQADLVESLI